MISYNIIHVCVQYVRPNKFISCFTALRPKQFISCFLALRPNKFLVSRPSGQTYFFFPGPQAKLI